MIIDLTAAILGSLFAIFMVAFSYYGFAIYFDNKIKKRKDKNNENKKSN